MSTATRATFTSPTREQIIAALDLRAEAAELGIVFAGQENASGWATCYRLGSDERNPSAGFNVHTGYYKEFSGDNDQRAESIFDLRIRLRGGTIAEAFRYYSERAGLASGKPKEKRKPLWFPTLEAVIEERRRRFAWKVKGECRVALKTPYHQADGLIAFWIVRFEHISPDGKQSKEIRPYSPKDGGWVESSIDAPRPIYGIPLLADHQGLVYFAEGEKCVQRLESIGLVATTSPHGSKSLAQADISPLKGRDVAILPDNDPEGLSFADKLQSQLLKLSPSGRVKRIALEGLGFRDDVADWIDDRRQRDVPDDQIRAELVQIVEGTPWAGKVEPRKAPNSRLPVIIMGSTDEDEGLKKWTPLAIEALRPYNTPPKMFQRGESIVAIKATGDDAFPVISPMSSDTLRGHCDRSAAWGIEYTNSRGEKGIKFGPPRSEVVRDIMSLPQLPEDVFPRLEGIVETPRFLPNRRLLCEPGYHADCRLFYRPSPDLANLRVPEVVTRQQMLDARSLIQDEVLADFTFANQASRAGAVALMLLPFVRPMIQAPTPLHHIEASCEGTGKTLLAYALCYPSLGRLVDLSTQKENEAEWRKALTTLFLSGVSHVCFDNMYNPLGWDDTPLPVDSGTLASAITTENYSDRKLGGNDSARIKINTIFISTGNNVAFSRELTRRIVPITLVASVENPSLRSGFKHDPLLESFVVPNRLPILEACLTLCRWWINQDCPRGEQIMGMFEVYSKIMGGLLDSIEVPGFFANRVRMIGKNTESRRWAALVEAWASTHGVIPVLAGQVWDVIKANGDLAVAFVDVVGEKSDLSQKQRLGRAMEKQVGQIWGGWRIVRSSAKHRSGSPLYLLQSSEKPYTEHFEDDSEEEEGGGDFVPF